MPILIIFVALIIAFIWMLIINDVIHNSKIPYTYSAPIISDKEYYISEEQKSIFKKNWTLKDFKKEFGNEINIKECHNHTTFEEYRCCIFIKGFFSKEKTWVRFASSLGELSIEEISNREKELMVGFTGRNYVLYDKNISKWETIDL